MSASSRSRSASVVRVNNNNNMSALNLRSTATAAATAAATAVASSITNDSTPAPIPLTETTDFGIWKSKVIATIRAKKGWQECFNRPPLRSGVASGSDSPDAARQQAILNKFHSFLLNSLDDKIASLFREFIVVEPPNPEALFDALCAHYEANDMNSKIAIQNELAALKLSEGGDIDAHIAAFKKLTSRLVAVGDQLPQSELIIKFVNSLPRSFESLVTALMIQDNLTLTKVIDRVKGFVQQLKTKRLMESVHFAATSPSPSPKFPVPFGPSNVPSPSNSGNDRKDRNGNGRNGGGRGGRGGSGGRGGNGRGGRGGENNRPNSTPRSQFNKDAYPSYRCGDADHAGVECNFKGECTFCHKGNHKAVVCRARIAKLKADKAQKGKEKAASVEENKEEDDENNEEVLPQVETNYCTIENILNVTETKIHSFILDSGASGHYVSNEKLLINVKASDPINVEAANGEVSVPNKVGTLRIINEKGRIINIHNVRVAPHFKTNIISVGCLLRKGARVECNQNLPQMYIINPRSNEIDLTGVLSRNNLFIHSKWIFCR